MERLAEAERLVQGQDHAEAFLLFRELLAVKHRNPYVLRIREGMRFIERMAWDILVQARLYVREQLIDDARFTYDDVIRLFPDTKARPLAEKELKALK
jgi:hypothetical protein